MSLHQFAETHEVFNQVPSLDGANLYRLDLNDPALKTAQ